MPAQRVLRWDTKSGAIAERAVRVGRTIERSIARSIDAYREAIVRPDGGRDALGIVGTSGHRSAIDETRTEATVDLGRHQAQAESAAERLSIARVAGRAVGRERDVHAARAALTRARVAMCAGHAVFVAAAERETAGRVERRRDPREDSARATRCACVGIDGIAGRRTQTGRSTIATEGDAGAGLGQTRAGFATAVTTGHAVSRTEATGVVVVAVKAGGAWRDGVALRAERARSRRVIQCCARWLDRARRNQRGLRVSKAGFARRSNAWRHGRAAQ